MNKEAKLQITKDKLLQAAASLMEGMDDPMKVTSREIAKEAGVQPAMINYCFGSREDLIYCTFQKLYEDYMKEADVEAILKEDLSPKELLKRMHFVVARCLVTHFNFTKAITGFVLFKRDLSKESFSAPYVMKHYAGRKTEEECRLIAYELSTMMQLIIFRKEDIKRDFGIDLENEDELRTVVDMRVDLLLGE